MAYRILIVDDDEIIAEGLKYLIEKKSTSYEVIALALDGTEGYEIAIEQKPDIILTDVSMYEMNGLEMVQHLRQAGVHANVIILSGYADFDYAKKSIPLGVEDYLLKPIDEETLFKALEKSIQKIDKQKKAESDMNDLRIQADASAKTARQYQLKEFLDNPCTDEEQSLLISNLALNNSNTFFCAIFMSASFPTTDLCSFIEQSAAMESATDIFWEAITLSPPKICLLGNSAKTIKVEFITNIVNKIDNRIKIKFNIPVSVGIGMPHKTVSGLQESYKEAVCALNYNIIRGPECIMRYDEISNIPMQADQLIDNEIHSLEKYFINLDYNGCEKTIDTIYAKISSLEHLSPEGLQNLSMNILLLGIRYIPFIQLQLNTYLGKNIFELENISSFTNTEQLINWMKNMFRFMIDLTLKQNHKQDLVENVKQYITIHYSESISLETISQKYYVNPYYFSQLFKKKTGDTFKNYLITVRMERAKSLLVETDMKIADICQAVGYTDVNYFNQIFKKIYGRTPREFLKSIPNL